MNRIGAYLNADQGKVDRTSDGRTRLIYRVTLWAAVGSIMITGVVRAQRGPHSAAARGRPPASSTSTISPAPSTAFCDLLRGYTEQVRRISISLTDPPALKPLLEAALPAVERSESVATPAALADVATVQAALVDLKAGFETSGYDFSKLPPDLVIRLTSPEFDSSFGRLQALASGAC